MVIAVFISGNAVRAKGCGEADLRIFGA